jgi:ABC-type uncharacterized transport system substrate-binding protein
MECWDDPIESITHYSNIRILRKPSTMNKNVFCLALCVMLFALSFSARAQRPAKIHRIGYLAARSSPEPRDEGFRQGLRDLGYIEGKNIAIEYRYARGKIEELAGFVAEMVRLNVDVIVATGTPTAQRAKQATSVIPIVIAIGDDPVEMGLCRTHAETFPFPLSLFLF